MKSKNGATHHFSPVNGTAGANTYAQWKGRSLTVSPSKLLLHAEGLLKKALPGSAYNFRKSQCFLKMETGFSRQWEFTAIMSRAEIMFSGRGAHDCMFMKAAGPLCLGTPRTYPGSIISWPGFVIIFHATF